MSVSLNELIIPNGGYRTIMADPPWQLTRAGGWNTTKNHRPLAYPTMPVKEIMEMPVRRLGADTSFLFLWTVNAHIESCYGVARAWGYRPVTMLVWCKQPRGIGPGGMFSTTTEYCLYCRRGSSPDGREKAESSSWFAWPRTSRHSKKPQEFYEMVERRFGAPRLEIFARERRSGWDAWGNEIPPLL